ncbi:MAG: hypothetical protein U1F43_35740 [Myxococcota bacterium]
MKWLVASWLWVSACGTTLELVDDAPRNAWLEERTDVRVTALPLSQEERNAMFESWWPEAAHRTRWRITVETRALPEGAVVSLGALIHSDGKYEYDYSHVQSVRDETAYRFVNDPGEEPKRADYAAITVSPSPPSAGQTGAGWQIVGAVTFGLIGPRDGSSGLTKKEAAELQEQLRAEARASDDKRIEEWRVKKARYESARRTAAMLEAVEGCPGKRDGWVILEVGRTCTWISDGPWKSRTYGDWHEVAASIAIDGLAKDTEFLHATIPLDDRDVGEQLHAHGPMVFGRAR